jgi:hypothetical protein
MFRALTLAVATAVTLGALPAYAAEQIVIPPSGANYDVGMTTLMQTPHLTARERARLEQIRQEYHARIDAKKAKLATLMKQYRDMQAHYAPVPQQIKVHDQIMAINEDLKRSNQLAWAKAARLLEGKVVLVNQGGGGGAIVVPGEQPKPQAPKVIDPNAHPEQVPPPKHEEHQHHHP